ncbi:Conidial yellow pigment biosynthesis polyketide synthase [Lachnellula suecica]|uniref:Conidial yellow pigment biosynthesis polyketide synthase n=1 Tax=Lachnellula suecica TaxID=602035 RepID=A0A8T9CAH7_9HELO|nr:Conidial yellow pigment biosynthesis polyketide synthase [Lachnellula suecica]
MDVILFGDQTADFQAFLAKALVRKDLPLLCSFLEKVHVALQDEISSLPATSRRSFPQFSNVTEFVSRYYQKQHFNPAAESAIACLAQLTHFIGFFEDRPLEYLQISKTQVLGICTGLLAASAVASCNSLIALIPLAVQSIRVAFRLGSRVASTGAQIESSSCDQEWSTVVVGLGSEAAKIALAEFNDSEGLALSNKLYVSAVGAASVTITGPPSIRRVLFEKSTEFQGLQRKEIPIKGPYHASHLYNVADVDRIISGSIADQIKQYDVVHQLVGLSSSSEQTSALQLFRDCVLEILAFEVHLDSSIKTCVSRARSSSSSDVRVLAMGPTALANTLISSLKVGGGLNLSLEDYVSWTSQNTVPKPTNGNLQNSKIAIIGMAGRFPNAADHEAFWKLLEQGLDVHREIPSNRFDAQAHVDPSGKAKNKSHTPYGCFIDDPGLFDPRFFNMSPREATQTDPMQRLALSTTYEAMEMAGFVRDRTPSSQAHRVATFYGQTSDDWREINAAQDIDTYFITGGVRAFGPGRINYHFGFSGPSFSVDTACSSSFAAINLACNSLRAGDCDTVFAGGMNVLTNPDIFSGLSKGQFLSKTGSCKTYDEGADGYCRGDGVVTLILKRLDDAVTDHDPVLGVINGIATNHSAEAVSITHPHAGAQKFLFQKIMDEAGVDARSVKYVEMHGTGTQAGDGVEMDSVSSIFAPSKSKRRSDQPLFVGSAKSNIGHGEAVSGACALVKTLMMFQKNIIPPHSGIKTRINQSFPQDLEQRQLRIASRTTPFLRTGTSPRYIFINNFSAAGGNTAMLLEDAPVPSALVSDPRSSHLVVVSAKSLSSFKQNVQRLLSWSKDQSDSALASLAYTTTARRYHYQYRVAIEAKDMVQFRQSLSSHASAARAPISSSAKPQIAFAFTGQGSHYIGMGQKLFQDLELFRRDISDFDSLAVSQGFPSFIGLIDGTIKDLVDVSPVVTQLAITCSQIALTHLWSSWGITPSVVVGHSLGEYAALHVAGVLSVLDTIILVGRRAQLLVSACTIGSHAMLAVRASLSSVQSLLSHVAVEIACINGPEELVFSGTVDQVELLNVTLTSRGIKTTKLNVPYAFHSAQVDPILDDFQTSMGSTTFNTPQIPVISTLLGEVVTEAGIFNASYLVRHCRESVNLLGGIEAALESETVDEKTVWIEIGPHPVCVNMIKATIGKDTTAVLSLRRNEDPWTTISSSISSLFHTGVNIDWQEYHREFSRSHEVLSIPSYAYDDKVYWIDYKENWCLTKGEKSLAAPPPPPFSTTSIHKIVQEIVNPTTALVIGESGLSEPLLRAAIEGHLVNGVGLCPSSLYADMALTICNYAYKVANPDSEPPHLNVGDMETHSPLVLDLGPKAEKKTLQIEARIDFKSERATVTYRSILPNGDVVDQAKCIVTFEDSNVWMNEWERRKYLVKGRIDSLRAGGKGIHHIQRGLAYKLFSALVQYDDKYRGMEEVILSSDNLEATSKVAFQSTIKDGKFHMSPYFIDSVAHISGFIMNANDAVDSKKHIYISHGWESMRFARNLDADKKYTSYVKMQAVPGAKGVVAGDVYVFDGEEIIGVVGGLRFQCVPRALLDTLFGVKSKPSARLTPAPAKVTTQKVSQAVSKTGNSPSRVTTQKLQIKEKSTTYTGVSASAVTNQALQIIASEVGCEISELVDPIQLSDLGIDSLMSLSISGRFREELELNISSSALSDIPTIASLKAYLQQFESSDSANVSGMSTPDMASSDSGFSEDLSEGFDDVEDLGVSTENDDLVQIIRSTIAEEMGVEVEEISDNTDLATMGMDSLMSLSILGALREKTGLSMHSNLLIDNTCVEKIETSLGLRKEKPRKVSINITKVTTHAAVSTSQTITSLSLSSYPKAQSILLQGNPRTATHTLFLLPDGSGSATSYATIPDIAPSSLAVYGLNCPFMKTPEAFTIGVAGVTQIYMAEIQRRQPTGPYILGGWSAGGVLAFEMTRQLMQKGECVEKLLLIDSPCPVGLEALPSSFHRFCDSIGLLGNGDSSKIPSWLLPHFAAAVRELTAYSVSLNSMIDSIDTSKMPATTAIWARDGIVARESDPKPEWDPSVPMPNSMQWLVENRTHRLGTNGWERLVGQNIKCVSTKGNHFTMMRAPITQELSLLMKEALDV